MPIARFKMPDGRIARFEVPEGTAPEDAARMIEAQLSQSAKNRAPEMTTEQKREAIGGSTLQVGIPGITPIWDTGIKTSQGVDEFLSGMGRRAAQIGTLGTHQTPPEAAELLDDSGYATAGGVVADVGTMVAGGSLLRGAGLVKGANLLAAPKTAAQAATGGALYGGLTSNDRVTGALYGGAGGAAGYGAAKTLGAIVAPRLAPGAQELIDSGVRLTPGSAIGGAAKRIEDAATSTPLVGDVIRSAQRRTLADYNKKVINEALKPIGESLPDGVKAGREAIEIAQQKISDKYASVLASADITLDNRFVRDVAKIERMVKSLPQNEQNAFNNYITEKVAQPFNNPTRLVKGETFKEIDSALRSEYKAFQSSSDVYQRKLGDALRETHAKLMKMAARNNPEFARQKALTDRAYAKMSKVNEAASMLGAQEGVFTPAQLLNATKKVTSKRQFAAGHGFDQAQTEQAKSLMAQSVPDSGTPLRAIVNIGTLMGGAGFNPTALGTYLAGALPYTAAGQSATNALLGAGKAWRAPMRKGIEQLAPGLALLGTGAALESQ